MLNPSPSKEHTVIWLLKSDQGLAFENILTAQIIKPRVVFTVSCLVIRVSRSGNSSSCIISWSCSNSNSCSTSESANTGVNGTSPRGMQAWGLISSAVQQTCVVRSHSSVGNGDQSEKNNELQKQ